MALIQATMRVNLENTLSERGKPQKATYYRIPSTGNVQKRQIHRARQQINRCLGLGEDWRVTASGCGVSFLGF